MISYLALVLAGAAGVLLGMAIAGAILLEHQFFWVVIVRMPGDLHRSLRAAARGHGWAVSTEVLDRLRASFETEVQP
jgi:hypothetical protein